MIYNGEWRCGKREGFGTLSKTDPETKEYVRVFVGSWRNDKKEVSIKNCLPLYGPYFPHLNFLAFHLKGAGTYFYSPSAFYEGQWSEDQRSGWGRMQYENGELYEGEWLKDKRHGQGLLLLGTDLNCSQMSQLGGSHKNMSSSLTFDPKLK